MIRILSLLLIIQFFFGNLFGQEPNDTEIIDPIEILPMFQGGEKQLYCFLDQNLDKELLSSVDTSGLAIAQFLIDSTGLVTKFKIIKNLNPVVDKELLRVIEIMPPWIPGRQMNKCVSVMFTLPLKIPYENKFCR
jgi:periplasmic protein TonB